MAYNGSFLISEVNNIITADGWVSRVVGSATGHVMGSGSGVASYVSKMTFATDTSAMIARANTTTSGDNAHTGGAIVNESVYCWGMNPTPTNVEKNVIATNTASLLSGKGIYTNSSRSGWHRVGYLHALGGANNVNNHDRFDLSNQTSTAISRGNMTYGHWRGGGMSNEQYGKGYVVGGSGAGTTYHSTVDKWDHSSDSSTATKVANRPINAGDVSGGSTRDYGYAFAGNNGNTQKISRLSFASDTTDMITRAEFTTGRGNCGSHGNESFKYATGGGGPLSSTERLDVTNDNVTLLSRGDAAAAMASPHGGGPAQSISV